jgi:hypothetical protein
MGLGAAVTWFCGWHYYLRAARDLEKAAGNLENKASELKRLNKLMLLGMEIAGWVKLTRDEHGEITGFTLSLAGKIEAKSTLSATATLTKAQEPKSS